MKLILSLSLIWTLSSTAEALRCWHDEGDGNREMRSCKPNELCQTIAARVTSKRTGNVVRQTIKGCVTHSDTKEMSKFSYNPGYLVTSANLHVCSTDGCNSKVIPYPGAQKKNNLFCFACVDQSSNVCNQKIQCKGVEDRCFRGTREDSAGARFHSMGCVSENLCEDLFDVDLFPDNLTYIDPPKCCQGSFCNSAWSVKLNVITLLFGLITFIYY